MKLHTFAMITSMLASFATVACAGETISRDPKPATAVRMEAALNASSASGAASADQDTKTDSAKVPVKSKTAVEAGAKKVSMGYEHPIRNEKNHIVKLETTLGDLTLELYHDVAPIHADSFLARVKDNFYAKTIFHRVVKGFMIQGGDPQGTGMGGAGYNLKAEFSQTPHERGTLSMARSSSPNSASSQFFICHATASFLNGQYTVFGQLLKGYDVLDKIATAPVNGESPVTPVKVLKTTVIK